MAIFEHLISNEGGFKEEVREPRTKDDKEKIEDPNARRGVERVYGGIKSQKEN